MDVMAALGAKYSLGDASDKTEPMVGQFRRRRFIYHDLYSCTTQHRSYRHLINLFAMCVNLVMMK